MLKKILTVILTLSIINISIAAERVHKGDVIKKDGVFLEEKEFNGMVKDIKIGDLNKELIEHYKHLNSLKDDIISKRTNQVNLLRKDADRLADRLEKTERYSNLQKTVWFVLGVITTSLAVKLGRDL